MAAAKQQLIIEQGATYNQTIKYLNPDGVTPIDLAGVTAKMQIRPTAESTTLIIELSTSNGRITITPATGKIDFYISDEDTNSLTAGKYVYDLELYLLDQTTVRLMEGKVSIHAAVTR
jgi:hypothetical protein